MPAPISDEKLITWAEEHLDYEAGMLVYTAEALAAHAGLPRDRASNVLVEAFAVHVRCVDGFLWAKRGDQHEWDAFAADFCAPGVWERERGDRPPALAGIREDSRIDLDKPSPNRPRNPVGPPTLVGADAPHTSVPARKAER